VLLALEVEEALTRIYNIGTASYRNIVETPCSNSHTLLQFDSGNREHGFFNIRSARKKPILRLKAVLSSCLSSVECEIGMLHQHHIVKLEWPASLSVI
jgi:hypothetical protein